jgi:hypothetical protein
MNIRPLIVRAFLRLYPADWRAEYGEELGALLSRGPITPHVFADVVLSATRERLRREAWKACGAALFVLTALGIFVNNTTPLSHRAYEGYVVLWESIVLLTGCLAGLRNRGASPSWSAAKAALIGLIPEMIALTLWAAGLFHPLVTPLMTRYGTLLSESRLALFSMTFPAVPQPGLVAIPLVAAIVLVSACVIGFLGGLLGRAISFLSPHLRKQA